MSDTINTQMTTQDYPMNGEPGDTEEYGKTVTIPEAEYQSLKDNHAMLNRKLDFWEQGLFLCTGPDILRKVNQMIDVAVNDISLQTLMVVRESIYGDITQPYDAAGENDYTRAKGEVQALREEIARLTYQLNTAAEVQTESNVSYCKALTDLGGAHEEIARIQGIARESINREREGLTKLDEFLKYVREVEGQREALRAQLAQVRATVEEWKRKADANFADPLSPKHQERMAGQRQAYKKVLALLPEEGGK